MQSPTVLRRIGTSALAGIALIAVGAATLVIPASAEHVAENGAVRNGPDLVFVDCVRTNTTTSEGTGVHPAPSPTGPTGRNPQAAATGSGCVTQAQTGTADGQGATLTVRFTENAQPVSGRIINFTLSGETTNGAPAAPGPTAAQFVTSGGTVASTDGRTAGCATDAAGQCSVRVVKTQPGTVTVNAVEQQSQESATQTVEFRSTSTALANLSETDRFVVQPQNDDYNGTDCQFVSSGQSGGNGATAGTRTSTAAGNECETTGTDPDGAGPQTAPSGFIVRSGTPARPVQVTYQLRDAGDGATATAPRPLSNREITLSVSGQAYFTPNCGPVTFTGTTTTPNRTAGANPAPDYRQCRFVDPQPGGLVGQLFSLGQSQVVRSDNNGLVTVTIAMQSSSALDQDGDDSTLVTTPNPAGGPALVGGTQRTVNPAPPATTTQSFVVDPAPIFFNTRNRPLNGTRVNIVELGTDNVPVGTLATSPDNFPPATTSGATTANSFTKIFRPLTATTPDLTANPAPAPGGPATSSDTRRRIVVFLQDQFGNLVTVPETDVQISVSTGGELRRECVTGGTPSPSQPLGGSTCTNRPARNTNFAAQPQPQTSPNSTAANNPTFGSLVQNRTTGSYNLPAHQDRFLLRSAGATPVFVRISSTWEAPLTRFNSVASTVTPTATPTSASPTSAAPTSAAPTSAAPTSAAPTTAAPTGTATTRPPTSSPTTTAPTGPPQRFASRVTLQTSHSRITAGNAPVLSGQVFDQNGSPLSGVNLTLFKKSYAETGYTAVAQFTTGFNGSYSIPVRPNNQTAYGVNTDDGRARSNIVTILVHARMNIASPSHNATVRNPITLSGTLLPAYNARPIGLAYINSAGRYVFLGQAPSRNGAWSVRSGGFVPPGTYTFVVYMSPTQGTLYGSKSLRLNVVG